MQDNQFFKKIEVLIKETLQVIEQSDDEIIDRTQLINVLQSQVKGLKKMDEDIKEGICNEKSQSIKPFLFNFFKNPKGIARNTEPNEENKDKQEISQIITEFLDKFYIQGEDSKDKISILLMKNFLMPPRRVNFISEEYFKEEEQKYFLRIASLEVSKIYKEAQKLEKKQKQQKQEICTEVIEEEKPSQLNSIINKSEKLIFKQKKYDNQTDNYMYPLKGEETDETFVDKNSLQNSSHM